MSVERASHGVLQRRKPRERTPNDIPLHLLMSSMQGQDESSPKVRRAFRVPALDGGTSPFGKNVSSLAGVLADKVAEAHRIETPPLPCRPQTTPTGMRRPHTHRPWQPVMCKLPLAEGLLANEPEYLANAHYGEDAEQVTPQEQRRLTAPASPRQASAVLVPAPPLTASPPCKNPRQRHMQRGISVYAVMKATRSPRMPPTLKELLESEHFPGALSTKSVRSESTACPCDLPLTPLVPSPIETPAGSSPGTDVVSTLKAVLLPGSGDVKSTAAISSITRWKKGEQIGSGSHGCVFKAQNIVTGHLFVVKENRANGTEYQDRLRRELDICKDLDHPHIVKCLGYDYCDHHLYVHLEYVSGGSLRGMLTEFGPLEQELMPVAMCGLVEGLNYLHTGSPPVVHRDIKSSNVLVGQDFCLKLADFGCSKRDDITISFSTVGSVLWMAPEVLRGQEGHGHGRKADIWSLGCVFIEMATAEKPWASKAFDNVFHAMKHIEGSEETPLVPSTLSKELRNLIARCLQRAESERALASELLEHELLKCVRRMCGSVQ